MKRNLLILAGLFIILLIVFLIFKSAEEKRLSRETIHDFFWADSTLIDSIAIKYAQWSNFFLRDGKWQMVVDADLVYPASPKDISDMIRTTNEMVLSDLISVNPANQAKLSVDTVKGTIIQFFGGGELLSDFILGRIGQDFTRTYVRRQGADSVYLAQGRFTTIYSKAPPQWMNQRLFDFGPGELAEIRWTYPDEEARLTRDGAGGYLISRDPAFTPVPSDSSESAYKFEYISRLVVNSYLPTARENEASFEDVILTLSAIDTTGLVRELIFAEDTSVANRYWTIRPGQPRPVGLVFRNEYDRLTARYEQMVAPDTARSAAE
jgi:hypothetical protein